MELAGTVAGPPDTPYSGGKYKLEIKIPDTYPFNPPKVRFITKIWHPNVSSVTGAICLDILKDQWAAAMSLRTPRTLLSRGSIRTTFRSSKLLPSTGQQCMQGLTTSIQNLIQC